MHVEIYSKVHCGYCTSAKNLLKNNNIPFNEQVLDTHFTRDMILEKFSTAKTYPIIVVDGFYIGGYNELVKLLESRLTNGQQILLRE